MFSKQTIMSLGFLVFFASLIVLGVGCSEMDSQYADLQGVLAVIGLPGIGAGIWIMVLGYLKNDQQLYKPIYYRSLPHDSRF